MDSGSNVLQDQFWNIEVAHEPASPVRLVGAAGGSVVAVGQALHWLRPGSHRLRSRELSSGETIHALAVEPWSPYRYAVAAANTVAVYSGHRPYQPTVQLEFSNTSLSATHVAWSKEKGETMLYLCRSDGEVLRLRPDQQAHEVLKVPTCCATANDDSGSLALLSLIPEEEAAAWILPANGTAWDIRALDTVFGFTTNAEAQVHLAVFGSAIALAPKDADEQDGPLVDVSWEQDESGYSFETPPHVLQGPLAFASARVLFGVHHFHGQVSILRYERGAGVTRVAQLGVKDDGRTGTSATITGLSWDDERRALWAASPELGLLRLTKPAGERNRSALPS